MDARSQDSLRTVLEAGNHGWVSIGIKLSPGSFQAQLQGGVLKAENSDNPPAVGSPKGRTDGQHVTSLLPRGAVLSCTQQRQCTRTAIILLARCVNSHRCVNYVCGEVGSLVRETETG